MANSTNNKNTWENVRKWQQEFTKEDVDNYPVLSSHEFLWGLFEQVNGRIIDRNEIEKYARSPIESFLYLTDMGFSTPPEVLMVICDCFNTYFKASGELSLEEVFFGREKPALGNYASRTRKNDLYERFSIKVGLEGISAKDQKRKRDSLEVIAENMFKADGELISIIKTDDLDLDSLNNNFPDAESFLRSWRRWKNRKSDN
ncbi:MAG: hypothetical protein ABJK64_11320 [Paraglaciecola sp.]|uniref:hypothetical protein n=1 Tax=Paraglaciecola sp. TaxID=1920173 RepID=UPI0032979F31